MPSDAVNSNNQKTAGRSSIDTVECDASPVGILAGGGVLPIAVAQAIVASGGSVHIVGIHNAADARIEQFPHSWCYWGGIDGMINPFHKARCRELVIVGTVRRPDLRMVRPDLGLIKSIPTVWSLLRGGDDSVLSKVVRFFEGHGFIVRGAHEFAPHLLPQLGTLGAIPPTPSHEVAMTRAVKVIQALGPFDVGQAAIAANDRIIALEGAGGTDAMIRAAIVNKVKDEANGKRDRLTGAVLVKLPKPGQEMRVDLPAIGPQTIELMETAGLAGVGIAAGRAIMLEREELLQLADNAQMFVAGIDDTQDAGKEALPDVIGNPRSLKVSSPEPQPAKDIFAVLGSKSPGAADWQDVELGRQLLYVLKKHDAGHSAVVARDYILAVQSREPIGTMLQQARRAQPWGGLLPGRRGVLVVRNGMVSEDSNSSGINKNVAGDTVSYPLIRRADLQLAKKSRMSGIAFCDGCVNDVIRDEVVETANALGLFVWGPKTDQ